LPPTSRQSRADLQCLDPHFKEHHYAEPVVHTSDDAHVDRWIVYGRIDGEQLFTAKELTVQPGAKVAIVNEQNQ